MVYFTLVLNHKGTQVFNAKSTDYIKGRPTYPLSAVDFAIESLGIPLGATADVGAGTGMLTSLLAQRFKTVFAIEPSQPMREQIRMDFVGADIKLVPGTAEQTTLPDQSVDAVWAAQAFHWFNIPKARAEFARILRPTRAVTLIWNERDLSASDLDRDLAQVLTHLRAASGIQNALEADEGAIKEFYGFEPQKVMFLNKSELNLPAFKSLVFSRSYAPTITLGQVPNPAWEALNQVLTELFSRHQQNASVAIHYSTQVYYGRLR